MQGFPGLHRTILRCKVGVVWMGVGPVRMIHYKAGDTVRPHLQGCRQGKEKFPQRSGLESDKDDEFALRWSGGDFGYHSTRIPICMERPAAGYIKIVSDPPGSRNPVVLKVLFIRLTVSNSTAIQPRV